MTLLLSALGWSCEVALLCLILSWSPSNLVWGWNSVRWLMSTRRITRPCSESQPASECWKLHIFPLFLNINPGTKYLAPKDSIHCGNFHGKNLNYTLSLLNSRINNSSSFTWSLRVLESNKDNCYFFKPYASIMLNTVSRWSCVIFTIIW